MPAKKATPNPQELTLKQEGFCQAYVETGNASEAYRLSYPVSINWKPESVHREACATLDHPKVSSRIAVLKAELATKHDVTVASLMKELEEARTAALTCETPQSSAAVSATMGKARIAGLDKQIVEMNVTSTDLLNSLAAGTREAGA